MRKTWYFRKNKENSFFQSQMDESNFLEEIRTWEHPPRYGSDQFKERVTLIFLENQKGLFRHLTTHFQLPVKLWTIFGPCREASYTAITLNHESNFTRREKNHSLFHWSTLTLPELLIRIWMSSKRVASMTSGISMGQEICLILWHVSLSLLYWMRNLQTDMCGLEGDWQEGKRHPGQIICVQKELWTKLGRNAKLKERQKWSNEKPQLDNARKLRGIYFIDPEDSLEFGKSCEDLSWSETNGIAEKSGTQI